MKWKMYILNIYFIITTTSLFSQINEVHYPYFAAQLAFQDGRLMNGIVLGGNDSTFYLISQRDWRKLKGEKRNFANLQSVMVEKGKTDWPMQITYRSLDNVELKRREGQSKARWIGLGSGFVVGLLLKRVANTFGCGDDNPDGICNPNEGVLKNGIIMGGIGFGIGSIFSIRFPKTILVKELDNKEWQQSLLRYSILR